MNAISTWYLIDHSRFTWSKSLISSFEWCNFFSVKNEEVLQTYECDFIPLTEEEIINIESRGLSMRAKEERLNKLLKDVL